MNRVAAIVPATDAPPTLARCLDALRGADEAPDEIVVADEPPGAGPAEARNLGAARTTADVLLFVDADVVVHRDAVGRVRRVLADDSTLAAVFGSYDDAPEAPQLVSQFRNLLHHRVHMSSPGAASTFWAGLGAIRRDAFERAGGFDAHRYPHPSVEDIDLGMRVAAGGGRIRLDPAIQGTHLKRWTLESMLRTDFARRGVPWIELLLERGGDAGALNLGARHRLGAAASLAAMVELVRRRPGGTALALAAVVALNRDLYSLLTARVGVARASASVPLHVLHHLAGVASVPIGALRYWTSSTPRSSSTASPSSRYSASVLTDQTS